MCSQDIQETSDLDPSNADNDWFELIHATASWEDVGAYLRESELEPGSFDSEVDISLPDIDKEREVNVDLGFDSNQNRIPVPVDSPGFGNFSYDASPQFLAPDYVCPQHSFRFPYCCSPNLTEHPDEYIQLWNII